MTQVTVTQEGAFDSTVRGQVNSNFSDAVSKSASSQTISGSITLTGSLTAVGAALSGNITAAGSIQTPKAYTGTTDALTYPGLAIITSSSTDACTLATPTATTDDGKVLTVSSTTAHAHTITTAANKIAGGGTTALGDTLTFAAKEGASCTIVAYQGLWYVLALVNVTLSEV